MDVSYINETVKVKTSLIVSVAEAKKQCNVETDFLEDDTELAMLIESARGAAEDYTGSDITETVNTLELIRPNLDMLRIAEGNYDSITSITHTTNAVDTVVHEDDYEVRKRKTDFIIYFDDSIDSDSLVIVFKTGFVASDLPSQIKSAILVKINDLYDVERTSYATGTKINDNKTFERLLNAFVINRW